MRTWRVTLAYYRREGTTRADPDRSIWNVEAAELHVENGDLFFLDREGILIRGFGRGQWIAFVLVASAEYAVAS